MSDIQTFTVEEEFAGTRLDRWLSDQIPELSRTRLKGLIDDNQVKAADGSPVNPKHKVSAGESYTLTMPDLEAATPQPERHPARCSV